MMLKEETKNKRFRRKEEKMEMTVTVNTIPMLILIAINSWGFVYSLDKPKIGKMLFYGAQIILLALMAHK